MAPARGSMLLHPDDLHQMQRSLKEEPEATDRGSLVLCFTSAVAKHAYMSTDTHTQARAHIVLAYWTPHTQNNKIRKWN